MRKLRYTKKKRTFWEQEYDTSEHLALSQDPSEDLVKFTRFLERDSGRTLLNPLASVLDLGCGNGRNLLYLAETFGMRGMGYDTSHVAIAQAKKRGKDFNLTFEIRSITEPLPLPDASETLVLDMMTSHVLTNEEREALFKEIRRVLKPGGWFFLKTFLLDEDLNAKRLLREHPGAEPGSYIHPEIGVTEHVVTEEEIVDALSTYFTVRKVLKSHRHLKRGRAFKRRSISLYAQKEG